MVLLLLSLCFTCSLPAPAWGQEDVQLLVPPPPLIEVVPPSRSAAGHLSLTHSDAGLGAGEYFSALGLHLAASGAYLGLTMALLVATQANRSPTDGKALLITAAALAPPILALPSSAIAFRTAKQRCPRERSWGWTYLAGVAGNALALGAAGLFAATGWVPNSDVFPGMNEIGLAAILLGGSVVTAGLEVLVLNLTGGPQVTAVPMALRGGGGLALVGAF
jgi:hypothetical protein